MLIFGYLNNLTKKIDKMYKKCYYTIPRGGYCE